ncbi:MAG: hypothetical protein E7462_04330 [Ruminococcaceae bacterium]|nr:hypothetical protein [Oscillospiraceae bacterium]
MDFLFVLLLAAGTFGLCFLFDKGFTGIFRSKPQHKTGLSVRMSQHYGGAGLLLLVLGMAAVIRGLFGSTILLIFGGFVAVLGIGLIVYYLSFGIYYDRESFVLSTFGKKAVTYSFSAIQGQKLYRVTGGNIMVELYLQDGRTVSVQSNMKGFSSFLDTAFAGWCQEKGLTEEACSFHDVSKSCWFPNMEEA